MCANNLTTFYANKDFNLSNLKSPIYKINLP